MHERGRFIQSRRKQCLKILRLDHRLLLGIFWYVLLSLIFLDDSIILKTVPCTYHQTAQERRTLCKNESLKLNQNYKTTFQNFLASS